MIFTEISIYIPTPEHLDENVPFGTRRLLDLYPNQHIKQLIRRFLRCLLRVFHLKFSFSFPRT